MIHILLLFFAVSSLTVFDPTVGDVNKQMIEPLFASQIPGINYQLDNLKQMLHSEAPTLSDAVINKVFTTVHCASSYNLEHNQILTIIDYSLPSNEKRLWVFNLYEKKLLFHTYVSHGIKSGTLLTQYFSNKYDSKASSIGVYKTDKSYYGREGLSLRLQGLDRNFNDNASNRSIVMHGGWYVDEQFIKRYGRPGRSWGCPALPLNLYQAIINTIKDNSLFVVYYPDEQWFGHSKFLNCNRDTQPSNFSALTPRSKAALTDHELRDDVLLASVNKGGEQPILVMAANNYERIFHNQAPLDRMLRRQINKDEYIAVSNDELKKMVAQNNKEALKALNFVIPVIFMVRGYYETQMKIVNFGKIKDIRLNGSSLAMNNTNNNFSVTFESGSAVNLKTTNRFIRWLGL